jgi:hypothetical protein
MGKWRDDCPDCYEDCVFCENSRSNVSVEPWRKPMGQKIVEWLKSYNLWLPYENIRHGIVAYCFRR